MKEDEAKTALELDVDVDVDVVVADGGAAAAWYLLDLLLKVLKALKMPAMKPEALGDSRPWQASIPVSQTAACQTPSAG